MQRKVPEAKKQQKIALGLFMQSLRKKSKLNQKEMAEKLGLTQGAISKLESGKMIPDLLTWHLICHEFDLFQSYLTDYKKVILDNSNT